MPPATCDSRDARARGCRARGAREGRRQPRALRATPPTTRCPTGARRSGGSPRCAGCAACTTDGAEPATGDGSSCGRRRRRRRRVERLGRRRPGLGRRSCPVDRSRPWPWPAPSGPVRRDGPGAAPATEPVVSPARRSADGASRTGTCSSTSRRSPRPSVVLDHAGSATYAGNVEVVVGDGATLTLVIAARLGRRRRARSRTRCGSAATPASARRQCTLGGDLRPAPPRPCEYAGPGGDAELLGLFFADAGQHLEHRLFVDHACRTAAATSPTRARCRATDAHTRLDRRRADPRQRRRHRDLRDQPQPAAHRRRPRRLGAQPRDRDRRDRRRRPRERHRPLRRRAAVLPAVARHPGGRGPPPGRPRLLRRPHRPHRRPRPARSGCSRASRPSWRGRGSPR